MKKILSVIFLTLITFALLVPAVSASSYPSWYPDDPEHFVDFHGTNLSRVVDNADILTDAEEAALTSHINNVINKYGYDLVIYTDVTNYGMGPYDETCPINFYRFNGYGTGNDHSGSIIYVNMDQSDRYYSVVGTGKVENAIYNYNEDIRDQMMPYMKNGDYAGALELGVELIDELYGTGKVKEKKTFFDYAKLVVIAAIAGLIVGLINLSRSKATMRTVKLAAYANDYVVQNSFNMRNMRDTFLYRNVTRTYIGGDSGSSRGGGSSHSGMHSSGGGGGSFSGGSSRF